MNPLLECYGTEQPLVSPQRIAWADWSLELVGGDVKEVRYQGHEILRSIGYILRDENWGTRELAVSDIRVNRAADKVEIEIHNHCSLSHDQRVTLKRLLCLDEQGLSIQAELTGNCTFSTARCGFTVLYPLQGVVGSAVKVQHSDGSHQAGHFPELIEPWQPFKDIQRLTYHHAAGIEVGTEYAGDIFEMEDQRAWMDASYKVYSRPLEKPWPYAVDATQPQRQAIHVTAASQQDVTDKTEAVMMAEMRMPTLGILLTPEMLAQPEAVVTALQRLQPGYLIYHCDPRDKEYASFGLLADIVTRCGSIPLHLEYVLSIYKHADFSEHLQQLHQRLEAASLLPNCLIISPSTDLKSTPPGSEWPWCPPLDAIFHQARELFAGITLGGGMISYFTELNRKRPPVALLDFVTHATNPIVHDAADRAVMQTLQSLPYITRSTRSIIGEQKPYHLGPSMISMRGNPYGADVYANPHNIRMTMTHSDPRQRGRFFASWLVGYLSQLTGAEISHWCPAGLLGSLGLAELKEGTLAEYPAWRLVKFLAAQQGKPISVQRQANLTQMAFGGEPGYRLVANLSATEQSMKLLEAGWTLDFAIGEIENGEKGRLTLPPFGVVCLHNPHNG